MDNASIQQETKNKIMFNKLVKNYWGLSPEGYKLFKHRLFFERPIAKEYKEIIGDSPDLRKRFPISAGNLRLENTIEQIDKGYLFFKNFFYGSFLDAHSVNYKSFNEGKMSIGNSKVKLFKAIKKFYFQQIDNFYSSKKNRFFVSDTEDNYSFYLVNKFFKNLFETMSYNYFEIGQVLNSNLNDYVQQNLLEKEDISKTIRHLEMYRNGIFSSNEEKDSERIKNGNFYSSISICFLDGKKKNLIFRTGKELKDFIDFLIKKISEIIGKYKIPKGEGLELVVSLNPVDWLLCSTEENWGSCLNLESSYMFWAGLPSMLGDKNRAMIYITDGKKKEYEGMKIDRFITRSWTILVRRKAKNKEREKRSKTTINIVREYPNNFGLVEIFKNNVSLKVLEEDFSNNVGRYYVEAIPFKIGRFRMHTSIYLDSCCLKIAKKNKAQYKPGEYFFYSFKGGGGLSSFTISKDISGKDFVSNNHIGFYEGVEDFMDSDEILNSDTSGLSSVIENDIKLSDFITL